MSRLALLLPAGICLLLGLNAGLLLLGGPAPLNSTRLGEAHGLLMTLGFVGALIALERAVAHKAWWAFGAPACLAGGAILAVLPIPGWPGRTALALGTVVALLTYRRLWRRSYDPAVAVQSLGAALAVGAALQWAGGVPIPALVPWLTGFLVLTITGERMELARVPLDTADGRTHDTEAVTTCVVLASAVVIGTPWPAVGQIAFGLALVLLAVRFAARDVAWHTVRATGLPRFAAACMLAGYAWLAVSGVLWMVPDTGGMLYDAAVHAIFLGFVMSMILAHAPVILPAVLRRQLPYTPGFWVVAALLHGSLLIRIAADLAGLEVFRTLGGRLGVIALLALVVTAFWMSVTASRGTPNRGTAKEVVGNEAAGKAGGQNP